MAQQLIVREILTKWGFKTDDKAIKRLNSGIQSLKKTVLAVGAAAVAGAASLFGLAKSVARTGDEARKTAQRVGMNLRSLQELQFAAQIGGVAVEDFNMGVARLSRTMSDANRGLETYKRAFDDLGISVIKQDGTLKASDEVLAEIADRFSKMPDGTKKTALAMELFGRSGMKLIPMLNQGIKGITALRKEAKDLGFIIDEKTAKASEQFNDDLLRMRKALEGIKIAIGSKLLPVITKIFVQLKEWILINKKLIVQGLDKFIKGLITFIKLASSSLKGLVEVIVELSSVFGGLGNAIKYAAYALGLFVGAKFLMALGNITMGIIGIAKAFRLAGNVALLAQIKMMAIPLLIGAAIVGLILIVQDLISYFKGADSMFGRFEKKWPKIFKVIKTAIEWIVWTAIQVGKHFLRIFKLFINLGKLIYNIFTKPREVLKEFLDELGWLTDKIKWFFDLFKKKNKVEVEFEKPPEHEFFNQSIKQNIEFIGPKLPKQKLEFIGPDIPPQDKIKYTIETLNSIGTGKGMGGGKNITPPITEKPQKNTIIKTDITAPISVTVPAGTSPDKVGEKVKEGVSEGLENILRSTYRDLEPQLEY